MSCGRSGDFFGVLRNKRSKPPISVIRSARARAFRRVLRVSRSAYLFRLAASRGFASSTRFFTSRGGGALLNAMPRFCLIWNLSGPPGHSARFLTASGLTHSLLRSCDDVAAKTRSEEHTSELQSRENIVCRLLLE